MQLSEHFSLRELTFSPTAARRGLDNSAPPEVVRNLKTLAQEVLQPARRACGRIRVTSGYRGPEVNRIIGGAQRSDHLTGCAADVQPLDVELAELGWWIQTHTSFKQLIFEFGAWLHVSWVAHDLRKQVLEARKDEGVTVYRPFRFAQPATRGLRPGGRHG